MLGRILFVDDDQSMCETVEMALGRRGFAVSWRTSGEEALSLLLAEDFQCVVTDLHMEGLDGLELCRRAVKNRPNVPVVVLTGFGSMEAAVSAIRAGAYDFITKPIDIDGLALTLERAVKHFALQDEVKRLRQVVDESQRLDQMIGRSSSIQEVFELINRVAETEASVLITGESGTGKELVAQAIHSHSRRKDGPFIAVNCAAMPESLLESELFGHAKGAFTDAKTARTGLFVAASGGTLFLDEIGEMPMGMQVKLLRALQERTVRPVGGTAEVPFDTRIVTATNRDLEFEVSEARFREDLFYRINVVRINVPPLRARGSDVLLLAQHFMDRFSRMNDKKVTGLSPGAAEKLVAYQWPGNVRELQNCLERAVALTRFEQIVVDDLPEKVRDYRSSAVIVDSEDPMELLSMHEVERRYILRVLQAVGGNKTQAAEILGLDRKTLYRKLERYNGALAAERAAASTNGQTAATATA
jgi:DNA-binding NtrC family response regulator